MLHEILELGFGLQNFASECSRGVMIIEKNSNYTVM